MRTKIRNSITLAIGDGANDVSMIQNAHIGIGVLGKEGSQASYFSDYAIPQFKAHCRLLFTHGRDFGVRFVNFVNWYQYKQNCYSLILLFCNILNGFSGVMIFEEIFWSFFPILMTFFAIFMYTYAD